jgi:hypothetical protein
MEQVSMNTNDKIKYHAGPVLKNAKVQLIFLGNWNDSSIDPSKERIETAIQNIINSEYYSKLYQYKKIEKPIYLGSAINSKSNFPKEFKFDDIENVLGDSIDTGLVSDFRSSHNREIIYILILLPGYKNLADKDQEDPPDAIHDYFEYKGNDDGVFAIYYGRPDEKIELQWITRAITHEIAEACTNPYEDDEGFMGPEDGTDREIADYCEKETGIINGEIVEGYWSNLDKGCVIPGGSVKV